MTLAVLDREISLWYSCHFLDAWWGFSRSEVHSWGKNIFCEVFVCFFYLRRILFVKPTSCCYKTQLLSVIYLLKIVVAWNITGKENKVSCLALVAEHVKEYSNCNIYICFLLFATVQKEVNMMLFKCWWAPTAISSRRDGQLSRMIGCIVCPNLPECNIWNLPWRLFC